MDQTRPESIRSNLSLAGLLFWFQLDLHAGVSLGLLQAAVGYSWRRQRRFAHYLNPGLHSELTFLLDPVFQA